MVTLQFAARQEGVDEVQPRLGTVPHGHCHRPVELHHGGRRHPGQEGVQPDDLGPVRGRGFGGLGVDGGNGGLEGVGAHPRGRQGLFHQGLPFDDQGSIPPGTILVLQQHQVPPRRDPRDPAGLLQQHEGEEAHHLCIWP